MGKPLLIKYFIKFSLILAPLYCLGCFYFASPLSKRVSLKLFDVLAGAESIRAARAFRITTSNEIIIISVDQDSLDKVGKRWPWSRDVSSKLVERLNRYKPKVVAFDYFFLGESDERSTDVRMAKAFADHGNVVIGSLFDENGDYSEPLKEFLSVEGVRTGAVNIAEDLDGVTRRFPLAFLNNGRDWIPSFCLSVYMAYQDLGTMIKPSYRNKYFGVTSISQVLIPDERGTRAIDASLPNLTRYFKLVEGMKNIQRVAFWKVLEDDSLLPALAGKIVFVGVEADILRDQFRTAKGLSSGVFLHALGVYCLLNNIVIFWVSNLISVLLFLLTGMITAICFSLLKRWYAILISLILMGGLLLCAAHIYYSTRLYIDISFPLLGVGVLILFFVLKGDAVDRLTIRSLSRKAAEDPLTGLLNFAAFKSSAEGIMERHKKETGYLCFIIYDLDKFKQINDTYGHDKGNDVLKEFSGLLKKTSRARDLVGRFGGDEFMLLTVMRDRSGIRDFTNRIQRNLEECFKHNPKLPEFRFSIGASINVSGISLTFDQFLDSADKALYRAKQAGRGRVEVAEV